VAGAGDDARGTAGSKTGTTRANSTTRDPLSAGGKRGKLGSSSSWQERSSATGGRSVSTGAPSAVVACRADEHTHTQPFNGLLSGATRGRPVPEETFARSHLSRGPIYKISYDNLTIVL